MPNLCIIPARALQDSELSEGDLRVLCAIGLHTDRDGAGCWATSRTLAGEAGVKRAQFFESIKVLQRKGFITVESGALTGRASSYTIILDQPRPSLQTGGVHARGRGGPQRQTGESMPVDSTSINAPFNVPSNAPTTRRGKLGAAEVLKDLRVLRNAQFPASLEKNWTNHFSDHEVRVIRAVGIDRILTTQPANDGPLLGQVASMLAEVA